MAVQVSRVNNRNSGEIRRERRGRFQPVREEKGARRSTEQAEKMSAIGRRARLHRRRSLTVAQPRTIFFVA